MVSSEEQKKEAVAANSMAEDLLPHKAKVKWIYEVWCTTRFVGFHQWTDAPSEYRHLSFPHRHEFHVKASVYTKHGDRAREFQELKYRVNQCIEGHAWKTSNVSYPICFSCEDMAQIIGKDLLALKYQPSVIEVSEDGENGGRVTYDYSGE